MSLNLNLDQVAAAQSQKEVTINDMSGAIDAAVTETLSVDVSVSSQTLSSTQYRSATHFFVTGAAVGGKVVTLPAVKRLVAIESDSTNAATFAVTVGATSLTMAIGGTALIYTDGTTDGIVQIGAPGGIGGPGDATTLDGLDSTAFAILAGQAGGQTLNGDTAASGNLTLASTSNATKGLILLTDASRVTSVGAEVLRLTASSGSPFLSIYEGVTRRALIEYDIGNNLLNVTAEEAGSGIVFKPSGVETASLPSGGGVRVPHATSGSVLKLLHGGTSVYVNQLGSVAADLAENSLVVGDTQSRFIRQSDGKMQWGSGAASLDTNLYRVSTNTLKTDDAFFVTLGLTIADNKDLKSSGFSTFNFLRLVEVTSNDTVLSGVGNIAVLIDSNNNNTDRAFEIRKNSNTQAGSTILLSVREDNVAGIGMEVPLHPWHVKVSNTLTSATQKLEQAGTGDVSLAFNISGVGGWNIGIDNSDADTFKIGKDLADIGLSTLVRLEGTNKVGIGANVPTPSATLNVYENNTSVAPIFRVEQDGTGDAVLDFVLTGIGGWAVGLDNSDSDSFKIGTNIGDVGGSPKLTILTTGEVGIGTVNPGSSLEVASGDIQVTDGKFKTSPSGGTVGLELAGFVSGGAFNAYVLNNNTAVGAKAALSFGRTTGILSGFIRSDNNTSTMELGTAGLTRLTILSTGEVGIGTSSPNAKLTVQSTTGSGASLTSFGNVLLNLDSNSRPVLHFNTLSTDNTAGIVWGNEVSNDVARIIFDNSADKMTFRVGGLNTINVLGGLVGIGSSITPSQTLDVGGNVAIRNADQFLMRNAAGTGNTSMRMTAGDDMVFKIDGTDRLTIRGDTGAAEFVNNVVVAGELQGARCCLTCGSKTAILDGQNIFLKTTNGVDMSATKGFTMARAGSIVGVSVSTTVSAFVAAGDFQADVTKAGAVVFSNAVTVSGNGDVKGQATQARGVDTFAAGDIIGSKIDNTLVSSDFTLADHIVVIEVQFDT